MFGTRKDKTLKVTITDTLAEEKWTLEGRLVWPWVKELRENWRKTGPTVHGRKCVVDLNGVTFVDKIGERMLRIMANQGAQFVAGGVGMRRVIERLKSINQGVPPWVYKQYN
jgi:hypothetical protein